MRGPLRLSFVRDVVATSGTQVLKAALAMTGGIVVARHYGPAGRGVVSVLVALGSMTVLLGTLGLHASSIYFMGRFPGEKKEVVSNNVVVATVGGALCTLVLLAAGLAFSGALLHAIPLELFLVFLLGIPFMYFNAFAQRIILGAGRVSGFNAADILEGSGLLLGTVTVAIAFGTRLEPLIAVRVAIEIAIAATLFPYMRRLVSFRFAVDRPVLRRQLAYSIKNYASSLLWLFLLQSDIVLCNHFLGSAETGVYSVAVSLGLPVTMLANAVGTLMFQRTSAQPNRALRIGNTNRALRMLTPLVIASMTAFAAVVQPIVRLLYGQSFDHAAFVLILLLPGLFAFSIEIVIINFLGGEGSPSIVYLAPLTGLVVNLGANLLAIPHWGISGAAVTSSACYSIVLLMLLAHYLRATHSAPADVFVLRPEDVRMLFPARRAGVATPSEQAPS